LRGGVRRQAVDLLRSAEDPAELDEQLVLRARRDRERRAEALEVGRRDVAQAHLAERREQLSEQRWLRSVVGVTARSSSA
jgi:hypothetical protein